MPASAIPFSPSRVTMAVVTDRTDARLAGDLRAAIWRAEPNLPVPVIRSLRDWSRRDSAQRRFESALFTTFSAIALLLVAAGLAGTLLYMVSMQRRSLGIRLALGATPGGLERSVLTRGVALAAIGVTIGAVGAWFAGRLLESRLYGVDARDARTLALAVGLLMGIAVVSSWLPARRAAGTNPIESLRAE
jgi:putative ABC transport system permease protein